MSEKNILHIPRINIEPSHYNHVLFAIGNQNIPFLIDMADVTGQKITFSVYLAKYFFVFARPLPVALHDLRTADGNLTVFTLGQFIEPGIDV